MAKMLCVNGDLNATRNLAAQLKACAQKKDLHDGTQLHADILTNGLLDHNPYVASSLVSMYSKCGALAKAQELLDELPVRDQFCWSALISGYAQQGDGEKALNCFGHMRCEAVLPDTVTYVSILKACGSIGFIDKGEQIHHEITGDASLWKSASLGCTLVDMYAKCGALPKAAQVLNELPYCDIVMWNALISGYVQYGQNEDALNCFDQLQHEGFSPNTTTFACALKACSCIRAADKGKVIHDEIIRQGLLGESIVLCTALMDMYVSIGVLDKAREVLNEHSARDLVSFSVLIAGYVRQDHSTEALDCYEQMRCEGLSPDAVTYASLLKACGSIGVVDKGRQLHNEIICQGLLREDIVLGNALVDMYVKCGMLAKAEKVLEELPIWDVVSGNTLITGYAQQGQGEISLCVFEQMQQKGFLPDAVTFASILKACGSVVAADKGKNIHDEILDQNLLGKDIVLGTALVDMYAKCGMLAFAKQVLDELPVRNVVTWNALIVGYAQQVQDEQALKCLEWMQLDCLSPNAVTFTCALNMCSRAGLVETGQFQVANMMENYGIKPGVLHQSCIVDLFVRLGCFDNAIAVINQLPFSYNPGLWCALLAACDKSGNMKLGKCAFQHLIQLGKEHLSAV